MELVQAAALEQQEVALFHAPRVCRLTGITYRQLDYWCRTGVIKPAVESRGSGTQRMFTEEQVEILKVLARLRQVGVSLQRLRPIAHRLAEAGARGWLVVPFDEEKSAAIVGEDGQMLAEVSLLGGAVVVEL